MIYSLKNSRHCPVSTCSRNVSQNSYFFRFIDLYIIYVAVGFATDCSIHVSSRVHSMEDGVRSEGMLIVCYYDNKFKSKFFHHRKGIYSILDCVSRPVFKNNILWRDSIVNQPIFHHKWFGPPCFHISSTHHYFCSPCWSMNFDRFLQPLDQFLLHISILLECQSANNDTINVDFFFFWNSG